MGSPIEEPGRFDNENQHSVSLSGDFLILATEVLQGDFENLMGYNPSVNYSCGPDCPVDNVTWHEAAAFCNALSDLEVLERCYECSGSGEQIACGLRADLTSPYACLGYRLPTEAEWEFAARSGGMNIVYPWDDETATCQYAVMFEENASCGGMGTWPACSRPSGNSRQGLCDLAGNVWEWVQDWYHQSYVGAPADGTAWEDGESFSRVVRGGSLYQSAYQLRAACRGSLPPSAQDHAVGFRCARENRQP